MLESINKHPAIFSAPSQIACPSQKIKSFICVRDTNSNYYSLFLFLEQVKFTQINLRLLRIFFEQWEKYISEGNLSSKSESE